MSKSSWIFILIVVCAVAFFSLHKKKTKHLHDDDRAATAEQNEDQQASQQVPSSTPVIENSDALPVAQTQNQESPGTDQKKIILTPQNFEANVMKCFHGENCELSENAWRMYQELKESKDSLVVDHFISFVRSKLKDPNFRDLYREDLRRMIDDFYPSDEKQFQDAAYYSYLGESQKAYDLYMDLRNRSDTEPTLKQPANLNIANVLFDLNRPEDSMIYYKMALGDLQSKKLKLNSPDHEENIKFIETRIEQIREKMGSSGEPDNDPF